MIELSPVPFFVHAMQCEDFLPFIREKTPGGVTLCNQLGIRLFPCLSACSSCR